MLFIYMGVAKDIGEEYWVKYFIGNCNFVCCIISFIVEDVKCLNN